MLSTGDSVRLPAGGRLAVLLGEEVPREVLLFRLDRANVSTLASAMVDEDFDTAETEEQPATQAVADVPLLRRREHDALADFHNQRPPQPP